MIVCLTLITKDTDSLVPYISSWHRIQDVSEIVSKPTMPLGFFRKNVVFAFIEDEYEYKTLVCPKTGVCHAYLEPLYSKTQNFYLHILKWEQTEVAAGDGGKQAGRLVGRWVGGWVGRQEGGWVGGWVGRKVGGWTGVCVPSGFVLISRNTWMK